MIERHTPRKPQHNPKQQKQHGLKDDEWKITDDGLRDLIAKNWNVLPGLEGAADVKIRVHFKLDKSGKIIGEPEVSASGGPASTQSALAFAAQMAVMRSQSDFLKILPPDKVRDFRTRRKRFTTG